LSLHELELQDLRSVVANDRVVLDRTHSAFGAVAVLTDRSIRYLVCT